MTSTTPPNHFGHESFTTMSTGDVEAIGAHCQAAFCHQLDFLPFKCESCKGKFCLDHRTESAHACSRAGAWAQARRDQSSTSSSTPKPTILTHESQCSSPTCKTLINTPLVPGIECTTCNRSYCLKHRMKEHHDCARLPPIGARQRGGDRGLPDALGKLRAWGAAKKASSASTVLRTGTRYNPISVDSTPPTSVIVSSSSSTFSTLNRIISPFTIARKATSQSAHLTALNTLKRTAKGDSNILPASRIYLHLEAVAEGEGRAGAKIPKADVFYSAAWSVGKVLDAAAKTLGVVNVNNRGGGEEEKLRVFWIEGGRLLGFREKLGEVKSGDTFVLLRGVGAMEAAP